MFSFYKCVRQYDSSDCACACIATIAQCFGEKISLATIREYMDIREGGISVYEICKMADKIGFSTTALKKTEEFNKNKMRILAELTRLRQICCDPSLCFENYQGKAAKLESCLQLVQSAIDGGHRMLLFSQFTSMLEIIQKKLDAEHISYYTITGSTPKKKRLEMVKAFNEGDVKVFLISL